ncbi:MAG: Uncharacterised protein [Methanobacteriota archaeon]|nr:MAG: Uncharacterised protein [Euryarchaeota archaeon]
MNGLTINSTTIFPEFMFGASKAISIVRLSFGERGVDSKALNSATVQPSDSIRSAFIPLYFSVASMVDSTLPLFLMLTVALPDSPGLRVQSSPILSIVILCQVCISREKLQFIILLSNDDSASNTKVGPVPAKGAPFITAGTSIQKLT